MPSVATAMRYRDVAAVSDWLCAAFGFQKHFVATSETGVVHYAQLTFGHAMLMLAPVRDTPLSKYMKQPDEIGGAETQSCYLLVNDADAHYARAKASGAEIILDIQDHDFGGRSYACRDPEGHIWNFGTYDPWQSKRVGAQHAQLAGNNSRGTKRWALVIGLLATMVASALVAGGMFGAQRTLEAGAKEAEERAARAAQARLNTQSSATEAAAHAAREAKEQLGRELTAKETAERVAEQAAKRLEEERAARADAENFVREARQELDRMRDAKDADRQERGQLDREREARELAERNAEQARQRATEEQSTKEAIERTAREMREQLDRERAAKEATERDVEQYRRRASEQQVAREAAERAANEARERLNRERNAKNAALKTAAQLRRQLSQVQYANELAGGPFSGVESPAVAPKFSPVQPKQKAKTQSPQE
jgi:uncharacterized glyoxalase superfamily protein PhnB